MRQSEEKELYGLKCSVHTQGGGLVCSCGEGRRRAGRLTFPRRIQLVPQAMGTQRGTEAREADTWEGDLAVSTHQGYIHL